MLNIFRRRAGESRGDRGLFTGPGLDESVRPDIRRELGSQPRRVDSSPCPGVSVPFCWLSCWFQSLRVPATIRARSRASMKSKAPRRPVGRSQQTRRCASLPADIFAEAGSTSPAAGRRRPPSASMCKGSASRGRQRRENQRNKPSSAETTKGASSVRSFESAALRTSR